LCSIRQRGFRNRLHGRYQFVILALFVPALLASAVALWRLLCMQRKRAAELRAVEARYRRMFEDSPAPTILGSAIRDRHGRLVDVRLLDLNPALERLTGRSAASLRGRAIRHQWPNEFLPGLGTAELENTLREGRPVTHEWFSPALQRRLRASIFGIGDEVFAAVLEDITSSVLLREVLQIQLNIASVALARGGADEMGEILGKGLMPLEEIHAGGLYILEAAEAAFVLVHYWGVSERFVAAVARVPVDSEAGRWFQEGRRMILNPGPERDALPDGLLYNQEGLRAIASFPLMDNTQRCIGCLSIASRTLNSLSSEVLAALESLARQIALALSRARAETSLRESEENFRCLAENIGDAIVICDSEGGALYVNPAAEHLMGRPAHLLIGLGCRHWLAPETASALQRRLLQNGFQGRVEVDGTVLCSEGSLVPVNIVATTTRWMNRPAVMFSLRDRSMQQRAEAEIARVAIEERRRLAREMHDGLAQDIAAAGLLMSTAHLGTEQSRAERLGQVRELIQRGLQRIRQFAQGADSMDAIEGRLADALRGLAERITADFGLSCRCEADTAPVIEDSGINGHLYYIAREAAMNAIRHGKARQIVLRLRAIANGGLQLEVESDGERFDPAVQHSTSGMGLRVMRYRADRIGATFDIRGGLEQGAIVTVALPAPFHPSAPGRVA